MSEKRGKDYVMCRGKKVRILKRGMKVQWKPNPTKIPDSREIYGVGFAEELFALLIWKKAVELEISKRFGVPIELVDKSKKLWG